VALSTPEIKVALEKLEKNGPFAWKMVSFLVMRKAPCNVSVVLIERPPFASFL
jgi:hypothetical protein